MISNQQFLSALGVLDLVAVAVFAVTGALVASRKEMDIFGFVLLGTVTGIGGGTVRDVVLGKLPVFWVKDPAYVVICALAATLVFFTAHLAQSRYRVLLWLDALGLALVAAIGAERGLDAGAGPVVAVVMGGITAAFGGIIRDVLGGEVPLILKREIYVTAALAGALALVLLDAAGLVRPAALAIAVLAGFLVRASALVYGWSLPPYKPRPGRPVDRL